VDSPEARGVSLEEAGAESCCICRLGVGCHGGGGKRLGFRATKEGGRGVLGE
jgi:hypothetical protein